MCGWRFRERYPGPSWETRRIALPKPFAYTMNGYAIYGLNSGMNRLAQPEPSGVRLAILVTNKRLGQLRIAILPRLRRIRVPLS